MAMIRTFGMGSLLLPSIVSRSSAVGGSGGGTHRYWQFAIIAGYDGLAMAEIELRATPGGSRISGLAPYASNFAMSAQWSPLENLVDSNLSTNASNIFTVLGRQYGTAATWDFGSPQTVREIVVSRAAGSGGQNKWVLGYFLRGSDDQTNWTTYLIESKQSWPTVSVTHTLGAAYPTSGRSNAIAWRAIYVTAGTNAAYAIATTMDWRVSSGGSNLTTLANGNGGTRAANGGPICNGTSTYADEFNMEKAYDGSSTTSWDYEGNPANGQQNAFIGWVFDAPQDLGYLAWTARFGFYAPQAFKIQYTTDFGAWVDVLSPSGLSWTNDETKTFSF